MQEELSACKPDCLVCDPREIRATRDFHVDDGEALNSGLGQHGGQFFDVCLGIVELGAANDHGATPQNLRMKTRTRERHTVGHKKQIGVAKKRRIGRNQVQLNRPMAEGGSSGSRCTARRLRHLRSGGGQHVKL